MPRGLIIAVLLASTLLAPGMGKKRAKDFGVTFHIETDAGEGPKFSFSRNEPGTNKARYFKKVPEFTDKEIEWFYPFAAADGSTLGVVFKMDATGTRRLENVSAQNPGRHFLTMIHPSDSSTLVIDKVVSDGIIVYWSGLTPAHIEKLRAELNEWKGTPPPSDKKRK